MTAPRQRRSLGLGLRNAFLLSAAATASSAIAQEADDVPAPEIAAGTEGATLYTPEDFARFAPRTALDMLRQVPGFIIQQADRGRGLGEGRGNVLINGRRISGKSNDALTELGRIPASSVVRIEIADAASLNIAGLTGQVANVIANLGTSSAQFAWRPEYRPRTDSLVLSRGEASLSGSTGPIDYTLGFRNDSFSVGGIGPALILAPDRSVIERRQERSRVRAERPKLSGSFKYDGPGESIGNLNLSYGLDRFRSRELSDRSAAGQADRIRLLRTSNNETSFEIGGDYELPLAGGRLKLIALHQIERSPVEAIVITSFADGAAQVGNRLTRTGDERESVVRGEYRWRDGVGDWQVSAEGAFNSLDNLSGFFTLLPDGSFAEIPLPGGTARVEEDRAEVRATYGRPVSDSVSVQGSIGAEYSKIGQTLGGGSARAFFRPKGFVSAAWKASPRLDIDAKLERKVGQLNFLDFLATVNLGNENRNAANPDLVPPQSWEADLTASRNLGPYGSTTLRLYGRLFTDIVDQIPIGETGEAPGNLDSATVYGVETQTTFLFDPLGWAGAKLDARINLQNSSVEDPLTLLPRRISGSTVRNVELSLRQDVPGTAWAWGTNLNHNRSARNFRLGEISLNTEGPVFGNVFVEHKDVFGLTMRAALGNVYGGRNALDRLVFAGRRTGPIAFIEERRRAFGPVLSFSISGSL